jgi:integrating conjugative element protein (TIGR03759 family)
MGKILFPVLVALLPLTGLMADTAIDQSTLESLQDSTVTTTNIKLQSKVWNINPEEWTRYQQIMQGKGKYLWKDLDPITVLGLNAQSDSERDRYAEKLAIQEFTNTQKVILLDRAYNEAFNRLYGKLPIVDTSKLNIGRAKASLLSVPKTHVKAQFGDRYIAFVSTNCSDCNKMVKQILSSIQLGVSVDIHFKNDSRQAITQWATKQSISPESVEIGTITLNPDSVLFEQFGQPALPSLYYYNKATDKVNEVK